MAASPEPDPYVVLGVARSVNAVELRAAYHELVRRYHPDKHRGNPLEELASARMAEINRAYEILADANRRAAYDAGARGGGAGAGGPFAGWAGAGTGPGPGGFGAGAGGGRGPAVPGAMNRRARRVVFAVMLLPVLLRVGPSLVRMLVRLVVAAGEGLRVLFSSARGTPIGAAVMLAAIALLAFAALRRRRMRARRSGAGRTSETSPRG